MRIDGVQIHPLKQIVDDRGCVMHMLKSTDSWFTKFGEIYFSIVNPRVVKGFHNHKIMVINYAVISGLIKLVLCDKRLQSPSYGVLEELIIGSAYNYSLITVPPGVWNAFQGLNDSPSIVANCANITHDPNEIERHDPLDKSFINYDWDITEEIPHG